jgi:hypothetical protein
MYRDFYDKQSATPRRVLLTSLKRHSSLKPNMDPVAVPAKARAVIWSWAYPSRRQVLARKLCSSLPFDCAAQQYGNESSQQKEN